MLAAKAYDAFSRETDVWQQLSDVYGLAHSLAVNPLAGRISGQAGLYLFPADCPCVPLSHSLVASLSHLQLSLSRTLKGGDYPPCQAFCRTCYKWVACLLSRHASMTPGRECLGRVFIAGRIQRERAARDGGLWRTMAECCHPQVGVDNSGDDLRNSYFKNKKG